MRIQTLLLTLVVLLLTSSITHSTSQTPRSILPLVARPLTTPSLTTVLECACGFANSAIGPDGKIYTIAQRFDLGGKLFVYVLENGTLREVADPGMVGPAPTTNDPNPSFGLPVQKNGPGSIFFTPPPNPEMVVIAPARPVGVIEGNYNLMMYRVPMSEIH